MVWPPLNPADMSFSFTEGIKQGGICIVSGPSEKAGIVFSCLFIEDDESATARYYFNFAHIPLSFSLVVTL
jgi:hypothetical protein